MNTIPRRDDDAGRPRLRLPTIPYRAFRALLSVVMRADVMMVGVENIPDGPCIACSNHPNREEILLGYRTFRRPVRIMVQHGLMDSGFLATEFRKALAEQYRFPRWMGALGPLFADYVARQNERLGCIPVVRDEDEVPNALTINRRAYRNAIAALNRGEVVGMAPEGNISPGKGIGELQKGAAWMAWHFARRGERMPVLPIIFYGVDQLNRFVLGRTRLIVALGRPLYMEFEPGETRSSVVQRLTDQLETALVELYGKVDRMESEPPTRRRRRHDHTERDSTSRRLLVPSGRTTSSTPSSNLA
jgi:1-acyl-sn-glycerol-3-phosphate acyltransferase